VADYTLLQAQTDIASLRGQLAHLLATAEIINLTVDGTLEVQNAIVAAPGGVAETWHDMRPLSNSFVGTVSSHYPPQYRLCADGTVEIAGYVQFPPSGGPNFNSVTFFTIPAAYRPSANTGTPKWAVCFETNVTPIGTPCVQVDSSGNFQFHNAPTSGMASVIAGIYGRYPLDSTGVITS